MIYGMEMNGDGSGKPTGLLGSFSSNETSVKLSSVSDSNVVGVIECDERAVWLLTNGMGLTFSSSMSSRFVDAIVDACT